MKPLYLCAAVMLVPLHAARAQRQLDLTKKADAAIAEPFTTVAGVRELPGNLVIVADQMERKLVLANFATQAIAPIGRQGDGPGEYRFPLAPIAGPNNTTWVVDAMSRRTLTISAAGKIVSSVATPTGGIAAGMVAARGSDRSGRLYFEGNSFDAEQGRFADSVAVVRWNPRDNRADVIAKVWSGGRVIINRPGGRMSMARSITPYPALDAWAVRPSGEVVVVHHDPFRVDVVDSAGRVHPGEPFAYTPLAISAADRDAYRDKTAHVRSSALLKDGGSGPPRPAQATPDEEFPKTMPPFDASNVLVSPEGELWIGRSHAAGDATWHYDVLALDGKRSAVATLSAGSRVVGFGAGTVYVARTDPADDLVYLERRRR